MRVKARELCYHDHKRRRIGDVFTIPDEPVNKKTGKPMAFSERSMEEVDVNTPETEPKSAGPIKEGAIPDKAKHHQSGFSPEDEASGLSDMQPGAVLNVPASQVIDNLGIRHEKTPYTVSQLKRLVKAENDGKARSTVLTALNELLTKVSAE